MAMTTALITHADCLKHVTPDGHPERVARLEHVLHALEPLDLKRITAPMAAEDDILRIHPASIWLSCVMRCPHNACTSWMLILGCRPAP